MEGSLVLGMEVCLFFFLFSPMSIPESDGAYIDVSRMPLACFSIDSGDVEDAPAPNALNKFEVIEKNDGVYIRGEEKAIRFGQRDPVLKCSVSDPHKVVVVGGFVWSIIFFMFLF